jgi:hypothetical protein
MVADGLSDREIAHEMQFDDHADRMQIWHEITELRARPGAVVMPPVTPMQRDKIPQIPNVVARLRRSGGVTKTGVATLLEINRDTLDDWINQGYVRWQPETAE